MDANILYFCGCVILGYSVLWLYGIQRTFVHCRWKYREQPKFKMVDTAIMNFQFFYSVLWLRNLTDISSLSTEIPPVTDIQDGGRRHLGFFRKFDIGLQWSISVPNLKDIYSLLKEIPPITEIQDGGHAILNFPKSSILAYRNLHLYPIWRTYLHWQREYGRKSKFKTAAIHIWNASGYLTGHRSNSRTAIWPVAGKITVSLFFRSCDGRNHWQRCISQFSNGQSGPWVL